MDTSAASYFGALAHGQSRDRYAASLLGVKEFEGHIVLGVATRANVQIIQLTQSLCALRQTYTKTIRKGTTKATIVRRTNIEVNLYINKHLLTYEVLIVKNGFSKKSTFEALSTDS